MYCLYKQLFQIWAIEKEAWKGKRNENENYYKPKNLLLSFPSASRLLYMFPLFSSTIYRTAFESPPFLVTRGLLKIFYLSKLSLSVKQCHNLNNSILISTCSTWMIGKKLNGKSKGWISVSQWWEKLRKEEESLESLWWVFVGIKRIFSDEC